MNERNRIKTVLLLGLGMTTLRVLSTAAGEFPTHLPDPDGKPAALDRPVQVFILLGQSNMLGFGKVTPEDKEGTLAYAVKTKNKYPEFAGNVTTVEARDFWRDRSVSPTGQGYHYNHNAETHMDVGNALGHAMAALLDKEKALRVQR